MRNDPYASLPQQFSGLGASRRGTERLEQIERAARQTFCVYDAPSPEAIRRAAQKSALPVNRITEVRVLDPYFYH